MSAWSAAARMLYERGGQGSTNHGELHGVGDCYRGLRRLETLGLAVRIGRKHAHAFADWQLTQRGVDWCENRLAVIRGTDLREREIVANKKHRKNRPPKLQQHPHRRHRLIATWLASLPRGVRIEQSPSTYILKEAA